jgi:hypothetical protein
MIMKKAVSFTLDADNLLWLKGQATARSGNVSAVVDELIREARNAGKTRPGSVRSVAGTIDLPDDDPDLALADEYIRTVIERSIRRPIQVKERSVSHKVPGKRRG